MESSNYLRHCVAAAAALLFLGEIHAQQAPARLKQEPAARFASADTEMILAAVATTGSDGRHVVAVGEHGVILLSNDGNAFRQAQMVPTKATLNAVSFSDSKNGWAAGHWGTILHTADGGETWTLQRSDTATDRPLFAIHFSDARHGVAVGLWSLLLTTQDGGQSWSEVKLQVPPDGGKADRNLLGMFAHHKAIYIAAERGMVLRSDDQGTTWSYLNTGYKGSFWTGVALADGTLLVGGLRGTIYRSTDAGRNWKSVETGTRSSITGIAEVAGEVMAVGLDGVVLSSRDAGHTFSLTQGSERVALTALVETNKSVLIFSKRGVLRSISARSK